MRHVVRSNPFIHGLTLRSRSSTGCDSVTSTKSAPKSAVFAMTVREGCRFPSPRAWALRPLATGRVRQSDFVPPPGARTYRRRGTEATAFALMDAAANIHERRDLTPAHALKEGGVWRGALCTPRALDAYAVVSFLGFLALAARVFAIRSP